jgi:hypothetical protein
MCRRIRSGPLIILLSLLLKIISIIYFRVGRGQEFDRFKEQIERYEEELKNPNLSEQGRQDVLSKLEGVYAEATHRASGHMVDTLIASGKITPIPIDSVIIPTEEPATLWKPPDGIEDNPVIPNGVWGVDRIAKILSAWRKTTPGGYYIVYSGYLYDDPKQGMVCVPWRDNFNFHRTYLTPKRSGGVRIVEEHGLYVVLKAENGDVFYFDPVGERFIDSLDAPTVTPAPSERVKVTKSITSTP